MSYNTSKGSLIVEWNAKSLPKYSFSFAEERSDNRSDGDQFVGTENEISILPVDMEYSLGLISSRSHETDMLSHENDGFIRPRNQK
jgi:hypothetical protein